MRTCQNLTFKKKIRQLQQKIEARTEITQDKVLNELANIGFAEPSKQIRVTDKIKALELLGKHLGIFTDKLQVKGDIKTINPYENLTTEDLIKLAKNDG